MPDDVTFCRCGAFLHDRDASHRGTDDRRSSRFAARAQSARNALDYTKEYAGVVKQLYRLLEHCREMAAEPGCADDWEQDVDALEKVIRALEREER